MELSTSKWRDIAALNRDLTVCVIPVGALEQHGPHLPLSVDATIAEGLARRIAQARPEGDRQVLLTPTIWAGTSPQHMSFPGTISLSDRTFVDLLVDTLDSLHVHGFRKFFVLNGHGGNSPGLNLAVRELHRRHPAAMVMAVSYWEVSAPLINRWRKSQVGGIGHACELETSLMMHFDPDNVAVELIDDERVEWRSDRFVVDLTMGRRFTVGYDVGSWSSSGAMGDPRHASAERGAEIAELIVGDLLDLVDDLRQLDSHADLRATSPLRETDERHYAD